MVEKMLMNKQNFKSAKDVDGFVPQASGLYCIRIKNVHLLPEPFGTILLERGHDILYIGIASENLYKRFLNQELRAKGHGTFFRSMGAVLGYKPPKGSLIEKRNKKNYKFSKTDELKIIGWINENLMVNWVESAGDLDSLETGLIVKYLPLLNLSKIQLRFKFCRICEKKVSKSRIEIRNWRYNLIALGNIPMLRVYSYLCFYGQRGDHHLPDGRRRDPSGSPHGERQRVADAGADCAIVRSRQNGYCQTCQQHL